MTSEELQQVIRVATAFHQGSFGTQKEASETMGLPDRLRGRVSDAVSILRRGIPELVAAFQEGRVPLQTGSEIASRYAPADQAAMLASLLADPYNRRTGLYAGKKGKNRSPTMRDERKANKAVPIAGKLLGVLADRAEAMEVTLEHLPTIQPDAATARDWRLKIRHIRKALSDFDYRVDWAGGTLPSEVSSDGKQQ